MPITVRAPNGATITFPDGTASGTIDTVMQQNFGSGAAEAQNDPELAAMVPSKMIRNVEVDRRAKALQEGKDGALPAFAMGTARGATSGLSERLLAGLTAIPAAVSSASGGNGFDPVNEYGLNRDALFKVRDQQSAAHPYAAAGGEIAGALIAPGPRIGVTSVPGRIGAGIAEGAVQGGVYGAAQADEGKMLEGGGYGALTGGVVGGVVPAVGGLAKGAYNIVDNMLSPVLRPGQFAAKKVVQRLADDSITPPALENRMARQPGLVGADVAGTSSRNLLRDAANVPGPQQQRITAKLNLRNMAANSRMTGNLEEAFGDPAAFTQHIDQTFAEQQNAAAPLFTAARQSGARVDVQPVTDVIDNIIGPPGSYRAAEITPDSVTGTLARVRRMISANPPGTAQLEDIGQLHNVRQDLDQIIANNRGTPLGMRLTQVRQSLTHQMEGASTDFRDANRIWAGEARSREVLELGRQHGLGKTEVTPQQLRNMSPQERSLFRLGLARGLKDGIDAGGDGADFAKRIYGSAKKRQLINVAFENQTERRLFANRVLQEAKRSRTRQAVMGNSTTAKQLAGMDDAAKDAATLTDTVRNVATMNVPGVIQSLLSRSKGMNREVASEVERLLMSRNPQDIARARRLLATAELRRTRIGGTRTAVERAAAEGSIPQSVEWLNARREENRR